jgi:hypothetical protein
MKQQQSLLFDAETLEQAKNLAEKWGLPEKRYFSAVVSRSIERSYTDEFTGIKIANLDKISDTEWDLIHRSLERYLEILQEQIENSISGQEVLQEDIRILQLLIFKLFE